MKKRRITALLVAVSGAVVAFGSAACSGDDGTSRQHQVAPRGGTVMPFDLNKTHHAFEQNATGGVETVRALDPTDSAQIGFARSHLHSEVTKFAAGDFSYRPSELPIAGGSGRPTFVAPVNLPGPQRAEAPRHALGNVPTSDKWIAGCLWQDRDPFDIARVAHLPSGTPTTWRSATSDKRRISLISVAGTESSRGLDSVEGPGYFCYVPER